MNFWNMVSQSSILSNFWFCFLILNFQDVEEKTEESLFKSIKLVLIRRLEMSNSTFAMFQNMTNSSWMKQYLRM